MKPSLASFIRSRLRPQWAAFCRRPFTLLVRLLAGRMLHGSGEMGDEELDFNFGVVLAVLALPGAFVSLFLFNKYATFLGWLRGVRGFDPLAAALPDEYFFIVLSMVVTGMVIVWRWDSIFLDRRDYANLVPLPIATQTIFFANFMAILFLTAVLSLDVNLASAIIFPTVVSLTQQRFDYFLQFASVHALVVVLASLFIFFAVFAIVGTLMVVLPHNAFRRISLYVRALIIVALLALLSSSFAVPLMIRRLPQHLWLKYLPPVWFVALCQSLRHRAPPALAGLGKIVLPALGIALIISMAAYGLSYRRCFTKIPETTDISPVKRGVRRHFLFKILDRTVLRSPLQSAGYRFAVKTLLRSERHSLALSAFVGLGIVVASRSLFSAFNAKAAIATHTPSIELLALPFILIFFILVGLRFIFEIPVELRANWIFRLSLNQNREADDCEGKDKDQSVQSCIPLARNVMLAFVLPWLFAIALPAYVWLWGWNLGLLHVLIVALWSALLAEVLLARFRKIPFTCSPPPFKSNAILGMLVYVLGFFVFAGMIPDLEQWILQSPLRALMLLPIAAGIYLALHLYRINAGEADRQLIFEETLMPELEFLKFSDES